jgi:hypothetical protein
MPRAALGRPARGAVKDGTSLSISAALMRLLGWRNGDRIESILDTDGMRLLLAVTTAPAARKIFEHRGTGQLWLRLPWVTIGALGAEEVQHQVLPGHGEMGRLLVWLPPWAQADAGHPAANCSAALASEWKVLAERLAVTLPPLWADAALSAKEIAARLGVSDTTILQHVKKLGLPARVKPGPKPRAKMVRPAQYKVVEVASEARAAVMHAAWPDQSVTLDDMMRRVNAADPSLRPIKATKHLYQLAEKLGLPRTRTAAGVKRGHHKIEDRTTEEQDLREARAMAAFGRKPEEIAEWFGWPLERAAELIMQVRERRKAA